MRASVLHAANPFDPFDRRVQVLRRPRRVRALAPRGAAPVIALLNGQIILRAAWRRKLRDGDQLMFVTLPRGGTGAGGSNPLRVLLSLALFAVAGPLAGVITGATAGMAFAGTQMGIQLAGTALINALMPTPRTAAMQQASPTYALAAQGNLARIEQAIPVQYGRLLAYPDFAAQPYWEYVAEEQYLYHLLCLGCGEFSIEEIRIEDTPITAFAEISYEVVPPGGNVTLFPTAVITSLEVSGQELIGLKSASWARVGTTITVTLVAHGYAAGQAKRLYFTSGSGPDDVYLIASAATDTFTITTPATGTSGACTVHDVLGGLDGFAASAAASVATRLAVDFVLPQGLYTRRGGGNLNALSVGYRIEARRVDDLGLPVGSWTVLATGTITGKTVTPLRQSLSYDLATPGRYRVRAWRTDALPDPASNASQLLMAVLRAYLTEPLNRGPVALIAGRVAACRGRGRSPQGPPNTA